MAKKKRKSPQARGHGTKKSSQTSTAEQLQDEAPKPASTPATATNTPDPEQSPPDDRVRLYPFQADRQEQYLPQERDVALMKSLPGVFGGWPLTAMGYVLLKKSLIKEGYPAEDLTPLDMPGVLQLVRQEYCGWHNMRRHMVPLSVYRGQETQEAYDRRKEAERAARHAQEAAQSDRFHAACEQVWQHVARPKVKDYWLDQMKPVVSAGGTYAFAAGPLDWREDKAKVYAVMAICAQEFSTGINIMPRDMRESEWFKANSCVWNEVQRRDIAAKLMICIEADLRKNGFLDDAAQQTNGSDEERGSADSPPAATEDQHDYCPTALQLKEIAVALGMGHRAAKKPEEVRKLLSSCSIHIKSISLKQHLVALDTLSPTYFDRFARYIKDTYGTEIRPDSH